MKLGTFEAHSKVLRASVADFCSKMRWAIWCWVGTKMEAAAEMNLDPLREKSRTLLLILRIFETSKILDIDFAKSANSQPSMNPASI